MQTFKIVTLGASGTGKTSLTVRFVNGDFIESYDPTIEDLYRKVIETNKGENCVLEIMDTSGTERFLAMRDLYIRNAQAFVLVYSITSRVSFIELENIKNYICQVKEKSVSQIPIVVLGNKCDLEENRAVFPEEVEALIKRWGSGEFMETSARIDMNIQSAFDQLVKQLFIKQTEKPSSKKEKKSNLSLISSSNSTTSIASSSSLSSISSSVSSSNLSSSGNNQSKENISNSYSKENVQRTSSINNFNKIKTLKKKKGASPKETKCSIM
ncbi:rapC, RAS family GTPase [Dictyostelium purpureum]|uniref:small monomeric GTPase n=1 Tax=Dictyostelium purpureum TaxID=5786 RepID=F0Z6W4_DICPU|nr:rapC, RAS family GTPase [Dictyostelium purpureum]EGC40380.1 rapC, RAS family GTPase [Dictyostelium purpureum]|eukprot:XP_003283131.1 rapC, RAS family GTPase [Dictyostelium purpureum]